MKHYTLEPEIAGGLGPRTDMDSSVHPPQVLDLHYVFEDWLGDHLVASFPVFLATETLLEAFNAAEITGYETADVLVETSPEFHEMNPSVDLPLWKWLKVGKTLSADLRIDDLANLIVSHKALTVIQDIGLQNGIVAEL